MGHFSDFTISVYQLHVVLTLPILLQHGRSMHSVECYLFFLNISVGLSFPSRL